MTPAEYQKDLRNRRKAAGLCTSCGLSSRPGKNVCETCKNKCSKSAMRWRKDNKESFNEGTRKRYENKKS